MRVKLNPVTFNTVTRNAVFRVQQVSAMEFVVQGL